jgi:hypothetical protein
MIVMDSKCKICHSTTCDALYFQQNFGNWTSGNNDIDEFIQYTQLSAAHYDLEAALEWIPYNRFYNIKYIAENEFSQVFRANWIDGKINYWKNYDQSWIREDCNMFVVLKSLNSPKSITLEFMNKVF